MFEQVNGELSNNRHITQKVTDLVGEIAAASKEQSQGIEEISRSIHEMDKVTQQTAAMADESSSASEEMDTQAGRLKIFVRDISSLVLGKKNGNLVKKSV
ncbi:MAG: hypothetical protein ACXWL9_10100 [Syntrophales bacterium]